MKQEPLVSIIIPHYRGKEILDDCFDALKKTTYKNTEIILVDNATCDHSLEGVEAVYPDISIVRNEKNLGYAGGCNSGFRRAKGEFVIFLNDDTVVTENWLQPLVEQCTADASVAAVQPKILSRIQEGYFDYAGGAGGLMDRFGYPFAKGRIFFTLEKDHQQYDESSDIFWASGTAMLVRRTILEEVGLFDEDFFAHMEEIDLNWRFHMSGYRVMSAPASVIYHRSGATLKPDSPQKLYLNHRNSLIMLIKNYSVKSLLWIFPVRIILEIVTLIYALVKRDFKRFNAATKGLWYVLMNFRQIKKKRQHVQKLRKLTDRQILRKMYRGSIVFEYFVKGIVSVEKLPKQIFQKSW